MTSIALSREEVVVGVDTHKDEHVAVALDRLGGDLGVLQIASNPDGYAQLLAWADALGCVAMFGVQGMARMAAVWRASFAAIVAR